MAQCNCIQGAHPVVDALRRAAHRLAGTTKAVLLVGEQGSGKEHFARHLHHIVNAAGPFLRIDCAAPSTWRLDRTLADLSVLRTSGGMLFLDALDALPTEFQNRLATQLRESMDGRGGEAGGRVVASIAASNASDAASLAIGRRVLAAIDPVELSIPALRDRRSDVPLLVEHFLAAYAVRHGVAPCRLDRTALVLLWQHDWPGNVRELASAMERLAILGRGRVIGLPELAGHVLPSRRRGQPTEPIPRRLVPTLGPSLRPHG